MNIKRNRDIMGELFSSDQSFTAVPGLEELDQLIQICVAPPTKRAPEVKKLLPLPVKRPQKTRKTTHYLSNSVYDGLTQANLALKKMLPEGEKSKASKSKLVNFALNRLLREIEDEDNASSFVQSILEEKE